MVKYSISYFYKNHTKTFLTTTALILIFFGVTCYIYIGNRSEFVFKKEKKHQRVIKKMPQILYFAGEEVHFKNKEAYTNYYRELKYFTSKDAYTHRMLLMAGIWLPEIEQVLKKYNLPDDLKYITLAESNMQNSVSPRGAVGFWQFTEITAKQNGLIVNREIDQRLDPVLSSHAAAKYFKKLHLFFGSWSSSAAAYNCGETALYLAFKRQGVESYYDLDLNKETASYMYRLLAIKDLVENPDKYGMLFKRYGLKKKNSIILKESIPDLRVFAKKYKLGYEQLRQLNPWIIGNSITLTKEIKSISIIIS